MLELNFYTTLGCHLCDEAQELLNQLASDLQINTIEIADDDALIEQYGTIIPVVSIVKTKQDLRWPFTLKDLESLTQPHQ